MFLTAMLAACLAAPVPKEKAKVDFWPRAVGDKWVYVQDGKEVSEEVTKVTEKDGETRVTTTHSSGPGSSWELEYVVKDGSVYQSRLTKYAFDPPIRRVDLDLKAGAKWESKAPLTPGVIAESGQMVAGKEEEVEVPAGKYQALRVVWEGKSETVTSWYAPDVGEVKRTVKRGEKEVVMRALKSFKAK